MLFHMIIIVSNRFSQFLHYLFFSRSRNSFLTFLLSYQVWVTSKIQVNFRFKRISVFMFPGSRNSVPAFLLRCHVWVTSNIPRNPLDMSYSLWVISKTLRTGSCFGFSKSFKPGSSVDMSANDSLTLETYIEDIGKIHKTQSSVLLGSSWTGSRPRFSWSPERDSSKRMSAMDSLTSKK